MVLFSNTLLYASNSSEMLKLAKCFWRLDESYTDSVFTTNVLYPHEFLYLNDGKLGLGRNDTMKYIFNSVFQSNNSKILLKSTIDNDSIMTLDVIYSSSTILILQIVVNDIEGKLHRFEYRYILDPRLLSRFIKPSSQQ